MYRIPSSCKHSLQLRIVQETMLHAYANHQISEHTASSVVFHARW